MHKNTITNWMILLILSMIWGSSFILMKKSLMSFTYLEVAFFRLIIAFLVICPYLISSFKNIKTNHIIPILIVSLIGTLIPAVLFAFGQTYLNSSTTGMLNSLTPVFTLIFGVYFFQKKWYPNNLIGVLIALSGTYVLLLPRQLDGIIIAPSLLIIIATMCYAISINTIKDKLQDLSPIDIAVSSCFISFIIPFLFFLNSGVHDTLTKISDNIESFYYLIILGAICTSFAIVLFNFLIKRSSALFGATTTYLIPVFAIIWGLLDNEYIHSHEFLGIFIILLGVMIINQKQLES